MTAALTSTEVDAGSPDDRRVRSSSPTAGRRLSAEERRSQLFDVALRLFSERGYAATTMDDIAEAAGVTKPLVYQHFDSKRALYLELLTAVSHEVITAIGEATAAAEGPRQQVERGFAAYFGLVVNRTEAFQLLYGRDAPGDPELNEALHRVEGAIAEAIEPLIDAGLDPGHRLLLAYAVVGMAEGASRHWMAETERDRGEPTPGPVGDTGPGAAAILASRLADLAWAGLRQVHRD